MKNEIGRKLTSLTIMAIMFAGGMTVAAPSFMPGVFADFSETDGMLSVSSVYIQGGAIQKVVLDKTGTRYARSATIINIIYSVVLFYFKELNDLPMSTTWVFVGLLCGRELAISTMNKEYKFKYVFPLIGKDFIKMVFGLSISVGIVLAIHYIIIPNGLGL